MIVIYFLLWMILHTGTALLFLVWPIPSLALLAWAMYRDWGIYAPEWSMPWGIAEPYAKWVNRITKAGPGTQP